ncbi:hypothetical protein A9Q99_06735 [Gammaproteobacteria bacterium 45_16_T64]|nr:hypothetical protein A9Q99_06735 [Gammaproteobacteria bacterium 45_16_T64]
MDDITKVKSYLLSKNGAEESYPFGPDAMVIKVKNKMFAIASEQEDLVHINLKCDPNEAQALRDIFDCVKPGYHMNKKHWNTVHVPGDVPDGEVKRMIDNSYALVVKGLTKAVRAELNGDVDT